MPPPLTVLMTEDIFDLSNNKMTTKERVSIAKKVIGEMKLRTSYDTAVSAEEDGNFDFVPPDWILKDEYDGELIIEKPRIKITIGDEIISFSCIVFGDDRNIMRYCKVRAGTLNITMEYDESDNSAVFKTFVPMISDAHFESYFGAMLANNIGICQWMEEDCNMYKFFTNEKI